MIGISSQVFPFWLLYHFPGVTTPWRLFSGHSKTSALLSVHWSVALLVWGRVFLAWVDLLTLVWCFLVCVPLRVELVIDWYFPAVLSYSPRAQTACLQTSSISTLPSVYCSLRLTIWALNVGTTSFMLNFIVWAQCLEGSRTELWSIVGFLLSHGGCTQRVYFYFV